MSASIVTLKDGQTENIQYPKTVKSALMKDDGTPLNPIEPSQIINNITTGGVAVPLSAQQGVVLDEKISTTDSKIGILSALTTINKTSVVGAINENSSAIGQLNDKSLLIQDYITVGNITGVTKNGYFLTGPDITGLPITGEWGKCIQTIYQDNSRMIYFYTVVSKRFFVGYFISAVGTFEWKEIATNEKYIMQASDMRNGWVLGHGNTLQKIGNRVFARFTISSGATAINNIVCNIPIAFRPSAESFITVKGNDTTTDSPVNQWMSVFADGNVQIKYINSKPNIFIEASWEV